MTTIEGGMILTNDKKIYELSRIFRSHGLLREANSPKYENKKKKNINYFHLNLFSYTQL